MADEVEEQVTTDFIDILQNSLWISSPEYAGWLTKRSSNWFMNNSLLLRSHAWQKKWVSLHGTELVYMDKEPTAENMKNIKIRRAQITASTVVSAIEDANSHGNIHESSSFVVCFNSDTTPDWYFRAESPEEKANWLIKISQVHAIAHWLDEYDRVKVLGIGGQGTVYELVHRDTGKRLALKEIEIQSEKQMKLAIAEALFLKNIVENVSHPNIMRIEKVFQVGSKFYLVFPLCTGGELYDAVAKRGHFSEHDAAVIMHDVISALHALHSHEILHLDIKPENILFQSTEYHSRVMLTDFGLSKMFSEVDQEQIKFKQTTKSFHDIFHESIEHYVHHGEIDADSIRGTHGYMSPEIIVSGYYSKAADVFAAGVVLYILLCGYPPFYSRSTRQTFLKTVKGIYKMEGQEWDYISDEAKDLVRKMLTVDPEKRITTAEILAHPWIKACQEQEEEETPPVEGEDGDVSDSEMTEQESQLAKELAESAPLAAIAEVNEEEQGLSTQVPAASMFSKPHQPTNEFKATTSLFPPRSSELAVRRRSSVRNRSASRHVNLKNALSHLADHIKVLKSDKMAATMTKFLSMNGQGPHSRLADSYLVPPKLKAAVVTKEETNKSASHDSDDGHRELTAAVVDQYLLTASKELRGALGSAIFKFFGSDKNRLTIEEFLTVRRYFGMNPGVGSSSATNTAMNTPANNALNSSMNIGEILCIKLMDRDNDGYISIEDISNMQVAMTQKNEQYLQAVFRVYTEALWYPGRNINYINTIQHINFKGSNSSAASTTSALGFLGAGSQMSTVTNLPEGAPVNPEILANSTKIQPNNTADEKFDVIEPPKYITSRHVAAIFEKFGYDPHNGVIVFDVLCETLQRIRLGNKPTAFEGDQETTEASEKVQNAANPAEEENSSGAAASGAKTEGTLWNRLSFRQNAGTATPATTESNAKTTTDGPQRTVSFAPAPTVAGTNTSTKKHKMDVNDFIRAARIDDVLVQVLFRNSHQRLYTLLNKANERLVDEQSKQLALPEDQRQEVTLASIIEEELQQSFQKASAKA